MKKWRLILLIIALVYLIILIPVIAYACENVFLQKIDLCNILECGQTGYLKLCYNDPLFVILMYLLFGIPGWVILLLALFAGKGKKIKFSTTNKTK